MKHFYIFIFFLLVTIQGDAIALVDFDQSMETMPVFGYLSADDIHWFNFLKALYQKNSLCMLSTSTELKIPKIIHQIWIGGQLPQEFKELTESWQRMHPDWIYKLWTDADIETFPFYNKTLFDAATNYGQKSDIWRYEILYRYGGLYVDTDFFALKPFDMLHYCYDFYTGIGSTGTVDILNGLIGSAPGHPILAHAITTMKSTSNHCDGIMYTTGPVHFMISFLSVVPQCAGTIIAFPCSFFYPSANCKRFLTRQAQDSYIKPESFAIHYWASSWQKIYPHI